MARSEASGGVGGEQLGGKKARGGREGAERQHRERDGISRQRQTLAQRRGQSLGSLGFEHMYRMPGKEWPIDGWRGDRGGVA